MQYIALGTNASGGISHPNFYTIQELTYMQIHVYMHYCLTLETKCAQSWPVPQAWHHLAYEESE